LLERTYMDNMMVCRVAQCLLGGGGGDYGILPKSLG
jgi:hypothetical protein